MDFQHAKRTTVMMFLLSSLSFFASTKGIIDTSLYQDLYEAGTLPKNLIWGSRAQDMVSAPLALMLAASSFLFLKNHSMKCYIGMLGLAWYFFYAFGLYAIQAQYTSIYLIYLAVFGLSFYSLVFGLLGITPEEARKYQIPPRLRKGILLFLTFMLAFLYPVWIMRLLTDVGSHVPGPTYGVFVLDLALVLPAIGIITYMLWKRKPFGVLLSGVALIKIFTLCLSWGFGEWTNPLAGNFFVVEMALLSSVLTVLGLLFLIPYMRTLKKV